MNVSDPGAFEANDLPSRLCFEMGFKRRLWSGGVLSLLEKIISDFRALFGKHRRCLHSPQARVAKIPPILLIFMNKQRKTLI